MTTYNTPSPEEIARVHTLAEEIGRKISSDPAFKSQYQADPLGTLTAQGMPAPAAHALLAQAAKAKGDEVFGYDDTGYDSGYYHDNGFHDSIVAAY